MKNVFHIDWSRARELASKFSKNHTDTTQQATLAIAWACSGRSCRSGIHGSFSLCWWGCCRGNGLQISTCEPYRMGDSILHTAVWYPDFFTHGRFWGNCPRYRQFYMNLQNPLPLPAWFLLKKPAPLKAILAQKGRRFMIFLKFLLSGPERF